MEPSVKLRSLVWLVPILAIPIISIIGCDGDSSPISPLGGQWVSDIPFTYSIGSTDYTIPHDNRIYESAHFLVFSDASGDQVKRLTAVIAETKLEELKRAFDISSSDELGIIDQNSKIMIYANKNMLSRDQQFFPVGMIVFSIDSPYWQNLDEATNLNISVMETFPRLLKHELMHVFQHLLGLGLDGYDDWPDVWFSEGIAEYVAGGTFVSFTTMSEINSWYAVDGHINPISIHKFVDYPVSGDRIGEYYPMFHVALGYLLSEDGNGKELAHVKMMYDALKNGDSFADAFEASMGISLDYFEENFYNLISQSL